MNTLSLNLLRSVRRGAFILLCVSGALQFLLATGGWADEVRPEIYLIKGFTGSSGSSQDNEEYEHARDALLLLHPELFSQVTIRIYRYDGLSEDGIHWLADDVRANGSARKIIVGFSAGVGRIKELVDEGVAFAYVITIDGYSEHLGAIRIDFTGKLVDHVENYLSTHWPFRGVPHICEAGKYTEYTLDEKHANMLKCFTDDKDGLTVAAQRAVRVDGGGSGGGVDGAGGGGVESSPPWLGLGGTGPARSVAQFPQRERSIATGLLAQFVPTTGPRGQAGVWVAPKDALELGDAISVVGMDYLDTVTHVPVASVFGAETAGSVYIHDYPVCRRVQDYTLGGLIPFAHDGVWWWMVRAVRPTDAYSEYFIPLTVTLAGGQARIDSRYLMDYFPASVPGTVLNYGIWAADPIDVIRLLESFIDNIALAYTIQYDNTAPPPAPAVYARSAWYGNGLIHLMLWNADSSASVHCFGTAWSEPRRSAAAAFDTTLTVAPESTEVVLPIGRIHDAIVYLDSGGFLDKVYVASGYWFGFDDSGQGGTSQVSLTTSELLHLPIPDMDSTLVCPPLVKMRGHVTDVLSWGYIGVGYAFQHGRGTIDLSKHDAVAFYCRGDGGTYNVKLETASVTNDDYYYASFQAPAEWQLVSIPFASLHQVGWGATVAWTGQDVRTISFVTTSRPLSSVELDVDRISFRPYPTSVDLSSLEFDVRGDEVLVSWQAGDEDGAVGFNVLRGESATVLAATRLNSALLPSGSGEYSYVDSGVPPGEHWYWVEEVDRWGRAIPYGPRRVSILPVTEHFLLRATPNPFAHSTKVTFTLALPALVTVRVYDPLGRVIRTLVDQQLMAAGNCSLVWDGCDGGARTVPSGVYFCRVQVGQTHQQVKLLLARQRTE